MSPHIAFSMIFGFIFLAVIAVMTAGLFLSRYRHAANQ
jgi:hypothetical protein